MLTHRNGLACRRCSTLSQLCGLHPIDSLIAVRIDDCLIDLIRLTIAPEIWALGLLCIPTRRSCRQLRLKRLEFIVSPGELAMNDDPEILTGLSTGELEALADSLLAPSAQAGLDELLSRNSQSQLETSEASELDRLLERVDQLTVLKTRAKYTLQHDQAGASRA